MSYSFPKIGRVHDSDDPLHQGRAQLILPWIDEIEPYGVWARPLLFSSGAGGHGAFFPPQKGTEVLVWGLEGELFHLFYLPIFNEDNLVPPDSQDSATAVMRFPGDLKIICAGDLFIEGGEVIIQSAYGDVQIGAAAALVLDPDREE
jgi:hypothetical protein